ncbi:hypothetical protein [Stieleria bergensis]|uniref:hypothetical protein n=1 Tax=Stieleria bergensis TaxID=2528025 RepID=UPI003AF34AB5
MWKGEGDVQAKKRYALEFEKTLKPYKDVLIQNERRVQIVEQRIFQTAATALNESIWSTGFVARDPKNAILHVGLVNLVPGKGVVGRADCILKKGGDGDAESESPALVPSGMTRKCGVALVIAGTGEAIFDGMKEKVTGGSDLLRLMVYIPPELYPVASASGIFVGLPSERKYREFLAKLPDEIREFESGERELVYFNTKTGLHTSLYLHAKHHMPFRLERYALGKPVRTAKMSEEEFAELSKFESRYIFQSTVSSWTVDPKTSAVEIVDCTLSQSIESTAFGNAGVVRISNKFFMLNKGDSRLEAFFDPAMHGVILPPIAQSKTK